MLLLMFGSTLKSSKIVRGGSPSISQEASVEYKCFFLIPTPKRSIKETK